MSSQGGVGGAGGVSRFSIPESAKKTIQSIREITGKQHSDEEIYVVLKECFMDPNETAQKLLHLDIFHEVKRKRYKKKETAGVQGRGGQGSRGNYYTSADAGGVRNASARRGNRKVENNAASRTKKTAAITNGYTTLPNGIYSYGSQLSVNDVNGETKDGLPTDKPTAFSVQPDVEPSATVPAPSFVSLIRGQEKSAENSNGSSASSTSTTVSGVYSSASDPVVVPTVSHHAGTVDTIKSEIGRQREAVEINNIQRNKHVPDDINVSKTEKTSSEFPILMHGNKTPGKSKASEHVKLSKHVESTLLEVVTSEVATLTVKADPQLLANSNASNGRHVIFPTHFQVSENALTFGSFDASFGLGTIHNNVSSAEITSRCPAESSLGSDEPAREPSSRSEGMLSTLEGDNADQLQSPPELEEVPEPEGNSSSDAELKVDQSNPEVHLHPEDNQCAIPNAPSYGFGLMPASSSHLAQFDGPEALAHDVSRLVNFSAGNSPVPSGTSTPPLQSSFAAAPQAVPLFRQPFPPNYFPYPHYLHPFYMHAMHQYLNLTGLPQQLPAGNLYMPPQAAAPGVKLPLPQFKPGTNTGNPAQYTIPSGYGPLTPPVGFNVSVPSVTSGSSSGNEDLTVSQLKENHIYTTGPLNNDSAVWMAAPGQNLSNLLVNQLYNVSLHGQHLPFSPAQAGHVAIAGLYQSSQTVAPPNVNTLLQQPQTMAAAAAEATAPASGAYQQPQLAQINWKTNY
ncbi:GBF-interacting protein 1-like isoform X2 [Hibiscus syriacus]|uniref:GBF-interacting protein 1-like isoform X2 n=1 Tax=Hibiscus syriacus TaxID=106335 RepID=UPI001922D97D|nr:GBF-interacting protein 1-like isoform X2 [Hibiscus syriacus]